MVEVQRAQNVLLGSTKEKEEFGMIKKVDKYNKTNTVQGNTESNPSRVANTGALNMSLADIWHTN